MNRDIANIRRERDELLRKKQALEEDYEEIDLLIKRNAEREAIITQRIAMAKYAKSKNFTARLRDDLVEGRTYGIIKLLPPMKELCGTVVTVNYVDGDVMQIDESDYYFATEMLDGATIEEEADEE